MFILYTFLWVGHVGFPLLLEKLAHQTAQTRGYAGLEDEIGTEGKCAARAVSWKRQAWFHHGMNDTIVVSICELVHYCLVVM